MIDIPEDMVVPLHRRDTSNNLNLRWLLRNLGVQNQQHPQYNSTINEIIKKLKS